MKKIIGFFFVIASFITVFIFINIKEKNEEKEFQDMINMKNKFDQDYDSIQRMTVEKLKSVISATVIEINSEYIRIQVKNNTKETIPRFKL
ncbi:MAG: hypothetical protein ACJLTB_00620 [Algoriphagus aquaeductus]|uniref:hypothetical protein n=1 Tax=Algoriphagus aquaeductus TaxID=475299 RepID=UPI003879DE66